MATDTSGRVAIQHAVALAADEALAGYTLLSDSERALRLLAAAEDVAHAVLVCGMRPQSDALIHLAAEATVWAEALQAAAAR